MEIKIVLVYSLKSEIRFLLTSYDFKRIKLNNITGYYSPSLSTFIIKGGVKLKFFKRKIRNIIKFTRKSLWILTGFAGGISITKKGEIFSPQKIYFFEDNKLKSLKIPFCKNFIKSNLLFSDSILNKKEKEKLRKRFPFIGAVDMESLIFAQFMKQYEIKKYYIIKIILDIWKTPLPDEKFIKKLKRSNLFKKFIVILTNPLQFLNSLYLIILMHYIGIKLNKKIFHVIQNYRDKN